MRSIGTLLILSWIAASGDPGFCVWPDFRGPLHNGHVPTHPDGSPHGLPLHWNETENVVWKTAIPYKGWSTPVIWENRIWLTTATEDGHEMFVVCLDRDNGEVLIDRKIFENEAPEPLGNDVNCYASPSPVIEEGRVYVHFGSYGTACLDSETGATIWERRDYPCRHYRGPGSSPFLYKEKLILTFDGADLQYLVALDKATGKEIWRVTRGTDWTDLDENGKPKREGDFRKAFCTPIIATLDGREQLIAPGSMTVFAYDPSDGGEIWRARDNGYSAACRPVLGDGMGFFSIGQGRGGYLGIRMENLKGDVTDTHIAWTLEQAMPKRSSPVFHEGLLYLANDGGIATCVEAKSGAIVWKERLGGAVTASPILADGRLYIFDEDGEATILKPGRSYEVLARNRLESGMMASPAVDGKALFLRTKTYLYRIEERSGK
ncbi:MAG: PQQ-binding-like beta-propeller repeat protein [Candidatus Omnitrophica bacterium]|nr:PQQ-binding-like beta-propeller repeat protein [Candidatus Omnitrophota bacterium]